MRAQYTSVAASWTRWLMPQVWKQAHQRHARTYKRTLPKIKLCSRTEALVSREAEVSLLALQIVLAEAVQRQRRAGVTMIVLGSARQELLRIRGAITTTIGAKLGPWQRRWYERRLARVQAGGGGQKVKRPWPRRKNHRAPKPPKILVLPTRLKRRIDKMLHAA